MKDVVFIQFSLYGIGHVQNSLYGTLFFQTRLYGSLFIATTDLCLSRFFQYRVYKSCYCGMIVMVCAGNYMKHYVSKLYYMEVYLWLLQNVSK